MHTSQTPLLVQSGGRAYRVMLFFYPSSLRSRFEQEMLGVLEDQIYSAWRRSGYRGVLQCWWRALAEVVCVRLPMCLDSLKIPALSILLGLFLTVAFFTYVIPSAHCPK